MSVVSFYCPMRPYASPRPRFTRSGRVMMDPGYQRWKREVAFFWGQQVKDHDPPAHAVAVAIVLHEWDNSSDIDNYAKSILDALQGLAFKNDNCKNVAELRMRLQRTIYELGFTVEVARFK